MIAASLKRKGRVAVAGLLWALVYGLVWGAAWFAFMRSAWYGALAHANRQMPWSEIWIVWTTLTLPLGIATAAYLARPRQAGSRSKELVAVVLVLWIPMTLGMFAWAWLESLSLGLIAVDSAVNLAGLAIASRLALAVVRERRLQSALDGGPEGEH